MSKNFDNIHLPCIMGILNTTPDSFSGNERFFTYEEWEDCLSQLIIKGAAIIDIGGESTRPGATEITWQEEWSRIEKILKFAVKNDKICVSVDTHHLETAELALKAGANIINDICGTIHFPEMAKIVKDFDANIVVAHNSRNDKNFCAIKDPIGQILSDFDKVFEQAAEASFSADKIILDPGIGFGKTVAQNLQIIKNFYRFTEKFINPVMCAVSKKSVLSTTLNNTTGEALAASTVASTVDAFRQGCKIFRVHDVAENLAALNFAQKLYE